MVTDGNPSWQETLKVKLESDLNNFDGISDVFFFILFYFMNSFAILNKPNQQKTIYKTF